MPAPLSPSLPVSPTPERDIADLPNLLRQAREGGAGTHAMLLRVQTDLFVGAMSHSPVTIGAFETFALGVIPLVADADLVSIAERLAPCPETPPAIVAALLARGGPVAAAVVQGLWRMDEADMEAIAASGLDTMAEAVAGRADLRPATIGLLLDRENAALDAALAANSAITLDRAALDRLIARARSDETLARRLAARTDLTPLDKAPLYPHAGDGDRAAIRTAFAALSGLDRTGRPADAPSLADLVALARARDEGGFRQALAAAADASLEDVGRILADPTGEMLAVALASLGLSGMDAAAIFLNREPAIAHSVERVFTLVDRVRDTPRPVAERILAAVAGLDRLPGRAGTHQPAMAPSGARTAPGQAAGGAGVRQPANMRSVVPRRSGA